MAVPIDSWLAPSSATAKRDVRGVRQAAEEALQSVLVEQQLTYSAWLLCDALQTAEFLASGGPPSRPAGPTRAIAAQHRVAVCAALAVLAREYLSADQFEALCGPVV